jgi:REP element-mobilizing transposase RayT
MPHQMSMEYPGAIYHVLGRGDRREPILLDEGEHHDFLKMLEEACGKTGFEVQGYCLRKYHFHLVVETPEGNLAAGMRRLLSSCSNRFNHRHERCGHLFSGRYKALVVEGSGGG